MGIHSIFMSEANQGRLYGDVIRFVFQKLFLYAYGEQIKGWPVWMKLNWFEGNYGNKSEG